MPEGLPPKHPESHRLVLVPELASLQQVPPWLASASSALGIGPDTSFKLDVCIEEWISNLVHHAGLNAASPPIELLLRREGDGVVLQFTDQGPAFDPTRAPAPEPPKDLESATVGGQGLHIMSEFAQSWSYQASSPAGNVLTLRFGND